jgi:hypothetical protein
LLESDKSNVRGGVGLDLSGRGGIEGGCMRRELWWRSLSLPTRLGHSGVVEMLMKQQLDKVMLDTENTQVQEKILQKRSRNHRGKL